jgi:VWA N-terminal.
MVHEATAVQQKMNLKTWEVSENFSYYSTKTCESEEKQPAYMRKFHCSLNYHFYDECVNTSFSSVHVPDYVDVKGNSHYHHCHS